MKIGICTNMISSKLGNSYKIIPLMKEIGFDYIELPLAEISLMSDSEFKNGPLKIVSTTNIPCLSMNSALPNTIYLVGDKKNTQELRSFAEKNFYRAHLLGAKAIGVGAGFQRSAPNAHTCKRSLDEFEESIIMLAEIAEKYQLSLNIESLNHLESNIINHLADAATLVKTINLPNVNVLADIYHMYMVEDDLKDLIPIKDYLGHIHVARALGRSMPCKGNEQNYVELFEILKKIDYEGNISIEATIISDIEQECKHAKEYLNSFLEKL